MINRRHGGGIILALWALGMTVGWVGYAATGSAIYLSLAFAIQAAFTLGMVFGAWLINRSPGGRL